MSDKSDKNIQIAFVVAELIIKYGITLAMKIIRSVEIESMSVDEIRALGDRVPHPDTFEKVEED